MRPSSFVPRACFVAALLVCAGILPGRAAAQPTDTVSAAADTVYEVRLADGSILIGRIVEERGATLTVETRAGARVALRREQIASITVRERVVDGEGWAPDPHATRLFFGPTARSLPRGEGYFGVYELFLPFLGYGVSDRLTLSAGTPVIPDVIGEIFYLEPKFELVCAPGVSAAVGALAVFATDDALDGSVGLLYGVGTFGDPDGSVTVGATVPFIATREDSDIGSEAAILVEANRA